MALFSKIKKILESQDACVISKKDKPEYVVLRWDSFEKMRNAKNDLAKLQSQVEAELKEEDYEVENIDINKIPV
ncbi:MAG TPA: hypothetical protein PK367_00835 [Candidatus Paceibacterota bacterium]|nr:hypothetical protein [Candidatus Paceibacterota bacterium]